MARVIDHLRKKFPGAWRYDQRLGIWENANEGWHVYRCAAFAPQFDGDDDSFETQYRRSDTGEVITLRSLW